MTKGAFVFIGVGVTAYLVASQTQIGWLYLFDAIIWSLLVLSALLPGYILRSLRLEQQIILRAINGQELPLPGPLQGEAVEIKLKVVNNGRFTRHFIKLIVDCPFEKQETRRKDFLVNTVNHESPAVLSYKVDCYSRGHYLSSDVILESGGPLGLFVRRRRFQLPLNLTVYPCFYTLSSLPSTGKNWKESERGIKSISAFEFYGSRSYQYGDPLKYVHWRNMARTGKIMVKEFEQTGEGLVTVVVDNSEDFGSGIETTLEYSIKVAATLAKLCADSGRNISIVAGDTALYNVDWLTAMDFLARLCVTKKTALIELDAASLANQFMVTVVPAVVTEQTSSLGRLAEQGWGNVILLEGFTTDEKPENVILLLGKRNTEIIHCNTGNLEAAVNRLSSMFLDVKSPGGAP